MSVPPLCQHRPALRLSTLATLSTLFALPVCFGPAHAEDKMAAPALPKLQKPSLPLLKAPPLLKERDNKLTTRDAANQPAANTPHPLRPQRGTQDRA